MQLVAIRNKLPEMRKTIRRLEKQIELLNEQIGLQEKTRFVDRDAA